MKQIGHRKSCGKLWDLGSNYYLVYHVLSHIIYCIVFSDRNLLVSAVMFIEGKRIGAWLDMVNESIKTCVLDHGEKAALAKNLHTNWGCITESLNLNDHELCPLKIPLKIPLRFQTRLILLFRETHCMNSNCRPLKPYWACWLEEYMCLE